MVFACPLCALKESCKPANKINTDNMMTFSARNGAVHHMISAHEPHPNINISHIIFFKPNEKKPSLLAYIEFLTKYNAAKDTGKEVAWTYRDHVYNHKPKKGKKNKDVRKNLFT